MPTTRARASPAGFLSARPREGRRLTSWGMAAGVALVTWGLFTVNGREIGVYDSQPAILAATELAARGTLRLNDVVARFPDYTRRPQFAQDADGNWRQATPVFSSLVGAGVAGSLSALTPLALSSPWTPALVAKLSASLVSSLAVALAFLIARRRAGAGAGLWVAGALAMGTNVWAVASQTLWQHESVLAGLLGAVWLLDAEPSVPAAGCSFSVRSCC